MDRKCELCGTPGVLVDRQYQFCVGCGATCRHDLVLYQGRKHTRMSFDVATRKYEASKKCESFGQWLVGHNIELIAKP